MMSIGLLSGVVLLVGRPRPDGCCWFLTLLTVPVRACSCVMVDGHADVLDGSRPIIGQPLRWP
jgi:hypothetical protein